MINFMFIRCFYSSNVVHKLTGQVIDGDVPVDIKLQKNKVDTKSITQCLIQSRSRNVSVTEDLMKLIVCLIY